MACLQVQLLTSRAVTLQHLLLPFFLLRTNCENKSMHSRLSKAQWQPLAAAHFASVSELTSAAKARRANFEKHPIEDFLWDYYYLKPNQLAKWHPGFFTELEDAATEYGTVRGYEVLNDGMVRVNPEFVIGHLDQIERTITLLQATLERPARTSCFGLHEWAMVYGLRQSDIRHEQVPLRLSPSEIAEVVDSHKINCSHYDAFRFFTKAAEPKNKLQPTRLTMIENEQPGCLHANMDVYKWGYKLFPITTSDFVLRAFNLAREIRQLDMQAAPYDVSAWGLAPVKIETADGKAEYVEYQLAFAERANELRRELIAQLTAVIQFVS
jgi:hypothetical protein